MDITEVEPVALTARQVAHQHLQTQLMAAAVRTYVWVAQALQIVYSLPVAAEAAVIMVPGRDASHHLRVVAATVVD